MEINKINSAIGAEIGAKKSNVNAQTAPAPEAATPPVSAQLSISQDWQSLEQSQQALQQLDDVDHDKIAALRQSLQDGSFSVDLDLIADKMLNQHG